MHVGDGRACPGRGRSQNGAPAGGRAGGAGPQAQEGGYCEAKNYNEVRACGRAPGRASERVGERASGRAGGRADGRAGGRMGEQASGGWANTGPFSSDPADEESFPSDPAYEERDDEGTPRYSEPATEAGREGG
jgi:hypothetical protein